MLAQTLQFLQADGIVDRKEFQVVPPHVEYRLTPLGQEAAEKVRVLADWIEINLTRVEEAWDRNGSPSDRKPKDPSKLNKSLVLLEETREAHSFSDDPMRDPPGFPEVCGGISRGGAAR